MHVIDHSTLPRQSRDGRERFAAAYGPLGCSDFELWMEMLDPNARAELQLGQRDRVVLVLVGHGKLLLDGAAQNFRAPCSLVLPMGVDAELVNVGAQAMQLVVALATPHMAPEDGPSPLP